MNRQERWRLLHDKSHEKNYENGKFKSNKYTKEEILEKRKYYESQKPHEKFEISEKRWMYEIKRQFELSKTFEDYPDCGFARLDFILEFGL